jgi:hypothetical protein
VAVAPDGRLVCSYVGRGGAGTSDYTLHLADSADGGATWVDRGPLWPDDAGVRSVTGSIADGRDGELTLFGTLTPLPPDGGPWWDPERQAIAANTLFWSRSADGGRTWSPRTDIPLPVPGSAEAPGPMLTTRSGRRLACYAPYPTFDPTLEVDRARVMVVRSDDDGATWQGSQMLHLGTDGGTAEAWLVELTDGRLFGSCWGMDLRTGLDRPNPWAVSDDGGATWSPTRSLGIPGQAVGLAALDDGRVAMVYNQRDATRDPVGVWLAVLEPADDTVTIHADVPVWSPGGAAASDPDAIGHDAWRTFTFGEPGVTVLSDGDLLVTIWSGVPGAEGVVWVRVRVA